MKAVLFRVEEVTKPGTLPAGRYLFARGKRIVLDLELREPMHPLDLKPLVKRLLRAA